MNSIISLFIFLSVLRGQSSTWDIIQDSIWTPKCVMCHDHGLYFAEQSGLILAEDVAYEELINVTPTNTYAAEDDLELVGTEGIASVYSVFCGKRLTRTIMNIFTKTIPNMEALCRWGWIF